MKRPLVQVVSGIAFRANRIFLQQRPSSKDFPFRWECPGGKIERGESPKQALAREWLEELSVNVSVVSAKPIWYGVFETENVRVERRRIGLTFFHVRLHGDPDPREGQGFGWFDRIEFSQIKHSLAPGNQRAHEVICRLWTRERLEEERP